MRDDILESLFQLGPMNVYQVADWLKQDIEDVSLCVAGMVLGGEVYLDPADGTLWYAGKI